jgi:hypothetical protein
VLINRNKTKFSHAGAVDVPSFFVDSAAEVPFPHSTALDKRSQNSLTIASLNRNDVLKYQSNLVILDQNSGLLNPV